MCVVGGRGGGERERERGMDGRAMADGSSLTRNPWCGIDDALRGRRKDGKGMGREYQGGEQAK